MLKPRGKPRLATRKPIRRNKGCQEDQVAATSRGPEPCGWQRFKICRPFWQRNAAPPRLNSHRGGTQKVSGACSERNASRQRPQEMAPANYGYPFQLPPTRPDREKLS